MATPQAALQPYVNAAPVEPLLRLKRGGTKPNSRIADVLKERFTHFYKKDKEPFREIINVGQLVSLYINGKQFLARNPYDGTWGVLPTPARGSDQRALNVLNNLKQNLLEKWEGSNPDILIRPARNIDTCASAAKAADAIMNYYERQFYDTWFSQQEALMGMTFGTYIDRYRFDDAKVSMSVLRDVFETKKASMGDGYGFCGDCKYAGKASDFTPPKMDSELGELGGEGPLAQKHCPQCQSTAVMVEGPAEDDIHTITGQEKRQIGDLVCELLPMPACRWDLAKRPEDSSWFIYRQRIPKGAITRVIGNVLLPQGETDHDHGLEVLRAIQHSGQAMSGFSSFGNQRRAYDDEGDEGDHVTFDEMWLSPDDYADINLIGDEKTVEGDTIPKGKLTDYFPDGLCAVGLNGMAVVLALYPEKHKNHIVSGTWFTQAQTGSGRGLADSVEIQKQFNTLNNQALAYMSSTYTPAVGYDNQIWTGNKMKYIGTPKTNIPFDLTKLPEGRKLADSIYQFQPTAMPNQFFNYAQNFLNVMFQKTSMVTDFANGEPGISASNTTATAAEIDQGNADSINRPIFLVKADARRRGAQITITLFREHFPMKRYIDLGGKYGQAQGMELSGADLKADLVFDVAPNSEMPKGPYARQKNRVQFFGVFGGAEGYLAMEQAKPKLVQAIAQDIDVDLETDTLEDVTELCRRRLNQMKQAAQVGVTDPSIIIQAIDPPIDEAEPNLDKKAKWFSEALDWDELIEAPIHLRKAVSLLAQGQFQAATMQQAELATGQGITAAAGAAPVAVGAAHLEQQAQQPESTEPDPSAKLQYAQEQSTQAHEQTENALDREHELKVLDKQLANEKESAKTEADHKIRVEKSKPKKPAAKKAA
jgi:hypothetical protein